MKRMRGEGLLGDLSEEILQLKGEGNEGDVNKDEGQGNDDIA